MRTRISKRRRSAKCSVRTSGHNSQILIPNSLYNDTWRPSRVKLLVLSSCWWQLQQALAIVVCRIKSQMIHQPIYPRWTISICRHSNRGWTSHSSRQMSARPISTKSYYPIPNRIHQSWLKSIISSKFGAWRPIRNSTSTSILQLTSTNPWTCTHIWKHSKAAISSHWFLKRTWWRESPPWIPSISSNTCQISKVAIKVPKSFSISICKHLVNFQRRTRHRPRREIGAANIRWARLRLNTWI